MRGDSERGTVDHRVHDDRCQHTLGAQPQFTQRGASHGGRRDGADDQRGAPADPIHRTGRGGLLRCACNAGTTCHTPNTTDVHTCARRTPSHFDAMPNSTDRKRISSAVAVTTGMRTKSSYAASRSVSSTTRSSANIDRVVACRAPVTTTAAIGIDANNPTRSAPRCTARIETQLGP